MLHMINVQVYHHSNNLRFNNSLTFNDFPLPFQTFSLFQVIFEMQVVGVIVNPPWLWMIAPADQIWRLPAGSLYWEYPPMLGKACKGLLASMGGGPVHSHILTYTYRLIILISLYPHIYIYIYRERERYISISLSLSIYIYIYIYTHTPTLAGWLAGRQALAPQLAWPSREGQNSYVAAPQQRSGSDSWADTFKVWADICTKKGGEQSRLSTPQQIVRRSLGEVWVSKSR